MSENQKAIKQMEIKTGVLKRLIRERSSYEEEVQNETSRLNRMTLAGKEMCDLELQSEVIRESQAMVADTHRRLAIAYDDMKKYLDMKSNLSETKTYTEAQEMLNEASAVLNK